MSRPSDPARRTRWSRAVAACLLLTTASMLAIPAPASAAPGTTAQLRSSSYVALGDSFSAGVGTGRDDMAGPPCLRSSAAYAPLWASRHDTHLTFLACSGAKISDVLRSQIPKIPRDASLITVTMGGNDTGFSSVLLTCSLAQRDDTCRTAVRVGRVAAVTTMPVQLVAALTVVRREAPHASIIVLGYPRLFEPGPCSDLVPSEYRRKVLNEGADLLNNTLSKVSRSMGARFVDVRERFAGHGVCAANGQAWINGPGQGRDSYHPNLAGYEQGYLAALTSVTG